MRHGKKFNHLGRTADHRRAMLANMAISLIMHKRITTTLAKAKALKKYVEPLITRSKDDSTNSRRVVIKLGFRQGDAAEKAFIELVDFDENMLKTPKAEKKTRRSRKSAPKAEAAPAAEAPAEEAPKAEEVAAPAEEAPKAEEKKAE